MTSPNIDDVKKLEKLLEENPKEYYRCDGCGSIYKHGTPEDEMIAEYKENFPNDPNVLIPRAIICDDCYNELYQECDGFKKPPKIFEKELKKGSE